MYEAFGVLLLRYRLALGWSQRRLATRLCEAAGTATLSRHEVSRWERGQRVPGPFWLGWLADVLSVPEPQLAAAAARAARQHRPARRLRARAARQPVTPRAAVRRPRNGVTRPGPAVRRGRSTPSRRATAGTLASDP
ncbi:helix-turn-helix domain-containing protein [Longispora albida]|uniref:helix-turn-helix domain-containing protein n=1 Tax=Longispora albida TaxID=203523 RepID=UPI00037AF66A|nr:helix-turn-helix transcriptional regulator [Longispora albida]